VVSVGKGETAYWAFIPNPLPPGLPADWKTTRLISSADRTLSELAGLGRNLTNPDLLISPFARREAVLSSRIEGTNSDMADLYLYEVRQMALQETQMSTASEVDTREVYNYVRALEYGINRLQTLPVSLRLLREVHAVLLKGVRGDWASPGNFRTSQNWIGGATINDAVYIPPGIEEMASSLDAFERYLYTEDQYPPLVRLAFIHYQFEAIHPFVDGNGRIGRLLMALLMVSWNLVPLPLLYLSAYFERNRKDYYDLLLAVSQKGAWEEWLKFFLQGIIEQAQDTIKRASRLLDLQLSWRAELQMRRMSSLTLSAAEMLFETPYFSAYTLVNRCEITHPAAMKVIHRLEEMGYIREITGQKRNRIYLAPGIIEVLE
jgi:Fic family protein